MSKPTSIPFKARENILNSLWAITITNEGWLAFKKSVIHISVIIKINSLFQWILIYVYILSRLYIRSLFRRYLWKPMAMTWHHNDSELWIFSLDLNQWIYDCFRVMFQHITSLPLCYFEVHWATWHSNISQPGKGQYTNICQQKYQGMPLDFHIKIHKVESWCLLE